MIYYRICFSCEILWRMLKILSYGTIPGFAPRILDRYSKGGLQAFWDVDRGSSGDSEKEDTRFMFKRVKLSTCHACEHHMVSLVIRICSLLTPYFLCYQCLLGPWLLASSPCPIYHHKVSFFIEPDPLIFIDRESTMIVREGVTWMPDVGDHKSRRIRGHFLNGNQKFKWISAVMEPNTLSITQFVKKILKVEEWIVFLHPCSSSFCSSFQDSSSSRQSRISYQYTRSPSVVEADRCRSHTPFSLDSPLLFSPYFSKFLPSLFSFPRARSSIFINLSVNLSASALWQVTGPVLCLPSDTVNLSSDYN